MSGKEIISGCKSLKSGKLLYKTPNYALQSATPLTGAIPPLGRRDIRARARAREALGGTVNRRSIFERGEGVEQYGKDERASYNRLNGRE